LEPEIQEKVDKMMIMLNEDKIEKLVNEELLSIEDIIPYNVKLTQKQKTLKRAERKIAQRLNRKELKKNN
jgi:hypothetical protein